MSLQNSCGKMRKVCYLVTFLGLALQIHPAIPTCIGLLRYSQNAMELIFQAQRFRLQDVLSNSDISTAVSGVIADAEKIYIDTVDILHISAHLVPNLGVKVFINTDLLLSSKVDQKVTNLRVLTNIISVIQIVQDSSGNPKLSINTCDTKIQDFQVFQETKGLELLRKGIAIALNHKLCLMSSSILLGINVQLGEFAGLINLGTQLQIRHFLYSSPTVTDQHIELGVNVEYYLLGKVLDMTVNTQCLPLPVQTSKASPMYSLLLHQDTFNAIFSAIQWAGDFNLDITGEMAEGVNLLTTETLKTVSTDIPKMYSQNYPIIMKVGVSRTPRVTLHKGKIVLYLQPSVELMVILPQERASDSLMVLNSDVQMNFHIKISENKLRTEFVVLNRNVTLSLDTSAAGSVKINELQEVIVPFFEKALLFHYKGVLGVGWTLPNLLNLKLIDPNFDVQEGYAVVSGNLQFPV